MTFLHFQLKTTIFTDEVLNKPVEPWVIAVSTIGGILGLVMLVAALWKVRHKNKYKIPTITVDSYYHKVGGTGRMTS